MHTALDYIARLHLEPHPEGGWYRESYSSDGSIPHTALPERYQGPRPWSTLIYFLLEGHRVSRLHRIHSDELWHFYAGSPLTVHIIDSNGEYRPMRLGGAGHPDPFHGVVSAGAWFGATCDDPEGFSLVGCTVAPGFHFDDFELGRRSDLLACFPQHCDLIERLTPP